MTAPPTTARFAGSARVVRAARLELTAFAAPLAILVGLGAIVAARVVASRAALDPLLVGAAFGLALAGVAYVGRGRERVLAWSRATTLPVRSLAVGIVAGGGIAALAIVGPAIGGTTYVPGLGRPAAPFLPWALITVLVAAAEEGVLRGALFDRLDRRAGLATAIGVSTIAFALMHVPLYGWHVVPLDLAVGLVLGGLRLWTRGLAAPAAAHAVADLATWWL